MGIDQILTPFIRSNVAISLVVALSLPACSSGRVELPTCQDKVEYGDECVYSLDDFEKNEFDKLVRVAEIYEPYFVAVGSLANNSDRLASWKELDFLESLDLTYEALFSWKVQDDGNSNNGEILVGKYCVLPGDELLDNRGAFFRNGKIVFRAEMSSDQRNEYEDTGYVAPCDEWDASENINLTLILHEGGHSGGHHDPVFDINNSNYDSELKDCYKGVSEGIFAEYNEFSNTLSCLAGFVSLDSYFPEDPDLVLANHVEFLEEQILFSDYTSERACDHLKNYYGPGSEERFAQKVIGSLLYEGSGDEVMRDGNLLFDDSGLGIGPEELRPTFEGMAKDYQIIWEPVYDTALIDFDCQ
ncbi:hypothetical protein HOC01_06680 [archaeon]|jgi:hypothetical protein|nr:hypothetical protein [archaeon]MBT6697474.1 hypothetical protein [archaeon]